MGGRQEDEPVPQDASGQSEGCVNVRIFFRERGMPVFQAALRIRYLQAVPEPGDVQHCHALVEAHHPVKNRLC